MAFQEEAGNLARNATDKPPLAPFFEQTSYYPSAYSNPLQTGDIMVIVLHKAR